MQIMPCKYVWITGLLLAALTFQSPAQDWGEAQVYFAEGGDFVLTAGGQRISYRPDSIGEGGFSLHNGDIVQTGPGSFVEIRLTPGGKVIRIAENTFISYNKTEGEGVSLGLSYGRLRLSDGKNSLGGGEIFVRSGTAEVAFHNGDISVDYTVQPAGETRRQAPVLRVYVFSGTADLIPLIRGSLGDYTGITPEIPRFKVNEREELAIEISSSLSYVERKPLNKDIAAYWDRYTSAAFSPLAPAPEEPAAPSEAAALPETPAQVPAGRDRIISPDYNPFVKANAAKNGFIVAGFSLSLIGASLQGLAYSDWNSGNQDNRNLNAYTGYGFLGLGILCFGAALITNPQLPVSDASK
jgi:hypothetical protein